MPRGVAVLEALAESRQPGRECQTTRRTLRTTPRVRKGVHSARRGVSQRVSPDHVVSGEPSASREA